MRLSGISVISPGHQQCRYHIMYIAMLEPQPATVGATSSVEEDEGLFHSLAVDTKKLFLCRSELQCGIKYCLSCLLVLFVLG